MRTRLWSWKWAESYVNWLSRLRDGSNVKHASRRKKRRQDSVSLQTERLEDRLTPIAGAFDVQHLFALDVPDFEAKERDRLDATDKQSLNFLDKPGYGNSPDGQSHHGSNIGDATGGPQGLPHQNDSQALLALALAGAFDRELNVPPPYRSQAPESLLDRGRGSVRSRVQTTLSLAQDSVSFGQEATLNARVRATNARTGIPDGIVTFMSDTVILGTAVLANGEASFRSSNLPVGNHQMRAVYNGNALFDSDFSQAAPLTVSRGAVETRMWSAHGCTSVNRCSTYKVRTGERLVPWQATLPRRPYFWEGSRRPAGQEALKEHFLNLPVAITQVGARGFEPPTS